MNTNSYTTEEDNWMADECGISVEQLRKDHEEQDTPVNATVAPLAAAVAFEIHDGPFIEIDTDDASHYFLSEDDAKVFLVGHVESLVYGGSLTVTVRDDDSVGVRFTADAEWTLFDNYKEALEHVSSL